MNTNLAKLAQIAENWDEESKMFKALVPPEQNTLACSSPPGRLLALVHSLHAGWRTYPPPPLAISPLISGRCPPQGEGNSHEVTV